MVTRGDRSPDVQRSVSLEDADSRVVHERHHSSGTADACQALDNLGCRAQGLTVSTHLFGAEQAEEAGFAKGLHGRAWESAGKVGAQRSGSDGVADDAFDGV